MVTLGVERRAPAALQAALADRTLVLWIVAMIAAAAFLVAKATGALSPAPSTSLIPLSDWISAGMHWFTSHFRAFFRAITWLLAWPLGWVRGLLTWLPWPATILISAWLGYVAKGWRLALFCAAGLMYTVVIGYWDKTVLTLALAGVAVPLSVAIGLAAGILAFRYALARRLIEPILDLMQTIPTFAYLIPILVLFGIGPVVGMTASAIYAVPPMVRNVVLGLQRVPVEIVESAIMSGSTRRQLLWWVQVPSALPTILIGVNQTVMAGLSMVVIAAMVGGVSDIGLEVFNTMKQAKFGQSILSGLVIAVLAMIMDRISGGFAERQRGARRRSRFGDRPVAAAVGACALALIVLARFVPALAAYPEGWGFYPAPAMNQALENFTIAAFPVTSAIKSWTVYYLMLPLKVGLAQSVRPSFWGFEMSPTVTLIYVALALAIGAAVLRRFGWRPAFASAVAATVYYFGTTGIPWPAFIVMAAVLGWQVGGWRIAGLAAAGLLFIVLTGVWREAMVSVELCLVGVAISFLLGSGLGIWAALNDRLSATLRPICDTFQTMPIFVFLIPAVMVFLVGEFTALIAMVMYAIVPSIRYTEHGIRTVPADVVEAARAMGTSRTQLLWQVQLPLALPEIMLGLNQTIMMALAMVVVAALVGAQGLGQEVMIALNQASTGKGIVSGLSIAFIAIIADRILQAWSIARKRSLGLA
jgi:glycine betaine/proline transport system permease protein